MIHSFIDFLRKITDPQELNILIDTVLSGWWFYAAMSGIVFAETGLLLGFVLPGDSLLFALGVVAGTGKINLATLIGLLMLSAIIGDNAGYFLGRRTGPAIFRRPDSLLFKQEYVARTESFFERYGGKTIIFARFVPIVRSFTPFMAGVGKMPYKMFFGYSLLSVAIWVNFLTFLGYTLGNVPLVKNNFEKAIFLVIALSFIPGIVEFIRHKRSKNAAR